MGMGCGCGDFSSAPRSFLTKEEKVEMLQEYKASLEKEARAVGERIADLKEKK